VRAAWSASHKTASVPMETQARARVGSLQLLQCLTLVAADRTQDTDALVLREAHADKLGDEKSLIEGQVWPAAVGPEDADHSRQEGGRAPRAVQAVRDRLVAQLCVQSVQVLQLLRNNGRGVVRLLLRRRLLMRTAHDVLVRAQCTMR